MLPIYRGIVALLSVLQGGKVEKEPPFAPVGEAYGHDSSVTNAQVSLAKDQAAWDRLWATHRGTYGANLPGTIKLADDRPPIDFKKHVVVGIFGGTTREIEGYTVREVVADGKNAFIRFVPVPPTIRAETPRVTQPYGFVVLPKTKLELAVQVPAGPDKWRTVATFEPTIEAKKKESGARDGS